MRGVVTSHTGLGPIEVNKEFEAGKISEYADGTMNNWIHHVEYVLPQVREILSYTTNHSN